MYIYGLDLLSLHCIFSEFSVVFLLSVALAHLDPNKGFGLPQVKRN